MPSTEPTGSCTTTSLSYSDTTNPDRLTSYGSKAITYNTNGDVASYDGWDYTWNKGKLSKISKTLGTRALKPSLSPSKSYTFTYNGQGQRTSVGYSYISGLSSISPVQSGEVINYTKQFKYDNSGRLIEEVINGEKYQDGSFSKTLRYLHDANNIVGVQYTQGANINAYYFQRNLQGDVVAIYDTNGAKVVGYRYDAWGNCTIDSSTTNYDLAHANPIRYRGYYYDEDTKLYYLNARYYSPEFRRFISPDDTNYLNPQNVNAINLYCYCSNDPVNFVDPSGHDIVMIIGLIGCFGVVIVLVSVATGVAVSEILKGSEEKNGEKEDKTVTKDFVSNLFEGSIDASDHTKYPHNDTSKPDSSWSGKNDTPSYMPNKYLGGLGGGGTLPDHTGYDVWDENGWEIK